MPVNISSKLGIKLEFRGSNAILLVTITLTVQAIRNITLTNSCEFITASLRLSEAKRNERGEMQFLCRK